MILQLVSGRSHTLSDSMKTWATRQGEMNSRAIMRKDELCSSPEITVQNVRVEKEVSDHTVLPAYFRNEETEVQKG